MKSLLLIHVNEAHESAQSASVVAVALSPKGVMYWGNATCLSRRCDHPDDWNAEIDRLVALLNELRREGLDKLKLNGSRFHRPKRNARSKAKRKRS